MRSNSSRGISSYARRFTSSAAQLTSPSTRPTLRKKRGDLVLVTDVADLVGAGEVDTDDLGSPIPELGGQLGANAPAGAGDHDPLARHGHARSPVFCSSAASSAWMCRVRREHVREARAEVERASVEVLDAAARLGDHQAAGADIPRIGGIALEERVDAPRRDVREAQRGGAETAHPRQCTLSSTMRRP